MHNRISCNHNLVVIERPRICELDSDHNLHRHLGFGICYWLLYLGYCEVCLQANQRGKRMRMMQPRQKHCHTDEKWYTTTKTNNTVNNIMKLYHCIITNLPNLT